MLGGCYKPSTALGGGEEMGRGREEGRREGESHLEVGNIIRLKENIIWNVATL